MRSVTPPPRYRRRRETPEWVKIAVGFVIAVLIGMVFAQLVYGDPMCAFQQCVKVVNVK